MEKNWREAKPKWVVEAAESEMAQIKRKLSLRWPDEARPHALDFSWGDYDRLQGIAREGTFYALGAYDNPTCVNIRKKRSGDDGWQEWRFSEGNSGRWTTGVTRGPLYETEREAKLAMLWRKCDEAALKLEKAWDAYIAERGYV